MSDRTSSVALRDFLERARSGAREGTGGAGEVGGGSGHGARVISIGPGGLVGPGGPAGLIGPGSTELGGGGALARSTAPARWQLDEVIGRLTELSGLGAVASLSAVTALVLEAQTRGEPAAWIGLPPASFFPPDLDDAGIDLDALVVVRVPDVLRMVRAADRLLRSAAFGLIVLDLGPASAGGAAPGRSVGTLVDIPIAVQGRLVGLAQHHDAAIVVITEKSHDAASLGSMVSLRAEAVRERIGGSGAGFRVAVRAVKDKRRGPGWSEVAEVTGPAGLT